MPKNSLDVASNQLDCADAQQSPGQAILKLQKTLHLV